MTNILPLIWGGSARQHELSRGGAAMTAPPSPIRPSSTSIIASSSRKPSSPRAKRSHFEGIADRTRYYKVSARDGTNANHTCHPRQHHTSNRGSNDGLREAKPIINRDAPTPYYSASASQGFKLPVSAFPFRRLVTPQPALRVSHLGHLSVTKAKEPTPNQLLGSKSSKDLPTLAPDFPRGIADENVSARRPEKKGGSLSHDSAIPIPFGDVLLRSPSPQSATSGQGLCGKADRSVLEGLIGVQEKDIKPLFPWDEADSQVVVDVDRKNLPSTLPGIVISTVLESVLESSDRIPTEIKSVVRKSHCDNSDDDDSNDYDNRVSSPEGSSALERNGYEHRGSQTTTQSLSDTPESGVDWSTESESFRTSGNGDAPFFEGLTPSSSGGKAFQGQDKNALGVASGIGSSPIKIPPRRLICWYAACGYPCCDGNVYKSPEVRHIIRDHCYSDKSLHHHRLAGECQRCKRLFVDKRSWAEHELLVQDVYSCYILSSSDLAYANYGPNQEAMSVGRKRDIDKAMKQYRHKNQILPPQCEKDDHDAWIEANYKLYIGESSVPEKKARYELGLWLVVWFTLFPDIPIPNDPFSKNNMGPLVCQEISDQALQSIVEKLQETYRTTLDQNYLDIIGGEIKSAALSIFQRLQNAETAETPKPKRQRFGTSTASQPELGSAANLAQPMSQDVFLHPRPYPMATSLSTPGPCNGSFVDSAYPPSSADSINIDPKLLEKEAHTNEGRREPDPQDLNSVGTHFDGWKYPKVNHMAQSKDKGPPKDNSINPSQTILEGLGPVQEFCRNNPRSSDC